MSALLVTNSLLSAGGQDGKIPSAHETKPNQKIIILISYESAELRYAQYVHVLQVTSIQGLCTTTAASPIPAYEDYTEQSETDNRSAPVCPSI